MSETEQPNNPPAPATEPAQPPSTAAAARDELLSPELIARIESLGIFSRKVFRGRMKGERRSPRRGESVEFADYRTYVPGDDLRFIDWNVMARLDKLFLKMFMEEEDLHIAIVLDASGSMDFGEPSKLTFAKQVAAALGYIALRQGDRLSVHTARDSLDMGLTGLRNRRSAHRLFEFLHAQRGTGRTDLTRTLREFILRHKSSGVVILISDFLDKRGYDEALRFLAMRDCDVICVHVMSPDEIEPNMSEDLRLVDLEDNAYVEVSRSEMILEHYKRTLHAFCEELRDTCHRRNMLYLYAVSDQPFEALVLHTLRKYGIVR